MTAPSIPQRQSSIGFGAPDPRFGVTPLIRLQKNIRRYPFYAAGAGVLVFAVLIAIVGPYLPFVADPDAQSLSDRLLGPFESGASGTFYLAGSDNLGRDIFSRVIHGARLSIGIAAATAILAGTVGATIGVIAGYRGGIVDLVVMRLVDLQMAFPSLVLAIFLLYLLGGGVTNLVILLVIFSWAAFARMARAETLSIRNQQFVTSAVALGASDLRIVLRHVVPHLIPLLAVIAVFDFSGVMLAEASLSFLGLGVTPPASSWGSMLADGRQYVYTGGWWLFLLPGVALSLTALSANLTSRWIQRVMHLQP